MNRLSQCCVYYYCRHVNVLGIVKNSNSKTQRCNSLRMTTTQQSIRACCTCILKPRTNNFLSWYPIGSCHHFSYFGGRNLTAQKNPLRDKLGISIKLSPLFEIQRLKCLHFSSSTSTENSIVTTMNNKKQFRKYALVVCGVFLVVTWTGSGLYARCYRSEMIQRLPYYSTNVESNTELMTTIIPIVERMGLMGKSSSVKEELEDIRQWHVSFIFNCISDIIIGVLFGHQFDFNFVYCKILLLFFLQKMAS
jgi:hypothetical protein